MIYADTAKPKRIYRVGRRYNYSAVDEYEWRNGEYVCMRTINVGMTRKAADKLADACNEAYWRGRQDAEADLAAAVLA